MNAPVEGILNIALEWLPVTAIAPSETAAQARRRKRYTPESIAELAANVKAHGIIQPVIVRKLPALRDLAAYELVAGERRWLAAKEAGLAHVPAIVRDIADADLLSYQLSENLKRQSLDAVEEAEGYRDLMHEAAKRGQKVKAEELADLFGISRRHVYNRLKLLKLKHPAAIEALQSGSLEPSKALRVARYPSVKLQGKAFEIVTALGANGEQISLREADERLRDKLMVRLDGVPFALDDDTMRNKGRVQFDSQVTHRSWDGSVVTTPPIPACLSCHNCSATDREFAAEVEGAFGKGAVVCTEKPCHDFKVKLHFERKVAQAKDAGLPVIDGDEAKAIQPHPGVLKDFIDLDAPCHQAGTREDDNGFVVYQTYREVLGKAAHATAILIDPHNKQPRELMPLDEAKRCLKKLGIQMIIPDETSGKTAVTPQNEQSPEERLAERQTEREAAEKQLQREEQERTFRRKLLGEVHARWKGPLKRDELQAVCDFLMNSGEWPEFVDQLHGGSINTAKMKEPELCRLLFALTVGDCVDYLGDSPNLLLAAAKRFKVDAAKLRKEIQRELSAEADEPAPARKAKKNVSPTDAAWAKGGKKKKAKNK